MKPKDIWPGMTVWILDRARVTKGTGPTKAVVAPEMWHSGDGCSFRAAGTRGIYKNTEAYATEAEAVAEWHRQARAEAAAQTARHVKIIHRLLSWQTPPKAQ